MGKSSTSFKKGQVANPNGRPKKGFTKTEAWKSKGPKFKKIIDAWMEAILEDIQTNGGRFSNQELLDILSWMDECITGPMHRELDATINTPDIAQVLAESLGRVYGSENADG